MGDIRIQIIINFTFIFGGIILIKIVADTTYGLPLEELEALGVDVIPQIIIFDDKPYRDDSEIDTPPFLKKLKQSKTLPKTAAPPPALYESLYKTYAREGISIIIPTPSTEVSGTYRSAECSGPGSRCSYTRHSNDRRGIGHTCKESSRLGK